MIIEYTNAIEPRNHSTVAMAIVITASALFFIPTTLIILGYYSSQPTGSLISPLPQTVLGQYTEPAPSMAENPAITEEAPIQESQNMPTIAAPNEDEAAVTDVAPVSGSNITDKVASIEADQTQVLVKDGDISENSQIYLSPRPGDKAIYSLKSKAEGEFTINVNEASSSARYIDYHIVNP